MHHASSFVALYCVGKYATILI